MTYGLLNAAVENVVEGLGVLGPLNTVNVEGVVDHLSCVLTRQALLQSRVYVVQNASSACVLQYVGAPCRTGQTSLVRVVTRYYEQHLCSFNAGYRRVRVKLVVALTSDNALGFAELDVALCPVVADVSQLGIVALISRVVDLVVAYNEDHLGHFRTGNDLVRLVRTIGVTGDYAQRRKHVHSVSSLNVGLIRERRTSEHGERASERQYQCKNLFEIRAGVAITRKTWVKFQKIHPICNIPKKRFLQMGYMLWIQPVRQSQSQTSTYII